MPPFRADSRLVNPEQNPLPQYRFGAFTLDPTRRVLLRDDQRIPLSAKSLDTLLALVTHYGETVSKNELLEAVWGEAVVEENSLNKCISELRKALGERRGQHDYIVTMTGVGYRFVAPVSQAWQPPDGVSSEAAAAVSGSSGGRKTIPRLWIALTAGLALVAAAISLEFSGVVAKRRLAIILPLKNLPATQDTAWLSTAIGEMLYHELAAAPGMLHLIPPDDAARLDRDLPHAGLREIRNYSGADLALAGTVTVLSNEADKPVRIDLRVQDLRSGEVLAAKSIDGSEAQTFTMVRSLAEQVRQVLGAAAAGKQSARQAPISVRAMQLYAEGLAALRSSDPGTAKDRLLEAVSADPSNALSYSALSEAWSQLGYDSKAVDAARRAFDLSSPLDDLDRLAIEARYRLIAHEWKRAASLYEAIWNLVPESMEDAAALVEAYHWSNRIEEATRVIARLRALPQPLRDDPRVDLLEAELAGATWSDYHRMSRLAGNAAEKARTRGMRALYAHARLIQSRAMWSAGEPGSTDVRHEARALCEEIHDPACVALTLRGDGNANLVAGRLAEAQESYSHALAVAREAGNAGEQLNDLNGLGLLYGSLGDFEAADDCYREAFRINRETFRQDSPMLLNNRAHISTETGRIAEARQQATDALLQARANHEVESEADALAALALLDRIGGDPRHAVVLDRQALAVARQSGKKLAIVGVEFDLALALQDTGSAEAAREVLRAADSHRGGDMGVDFELASAQLGFEAGHYADAERMARTAIEDARKARSSYIELRAESLLARSLLAQGRGEEARVAAKQTAAIRLTPDASLPKIEARFAEAAASGSELEGLAGVAQKSGYVQLALEIRLVDAERVVRRGGGRRLLHDVVEEAAAKGYTALAARARSVN